jgi:hypothetical protein
VVGRVDSQGKEKSCVDYARSYVRGFITVYMAWFLGVDAEDGFWTTYFKPLERLWTINRAQKDISLMRGEGLVDKDRLRLTEKGWGCMEEAIARFLKGEFNGISIIKEYPVAVLVAPAFALEYGVDLVVVEDELRRRYERLRAQGLDFVPNFDLGWGIIYDVLGKPELRDRLSTRLFQIRYRVIDFVNAALVRRSPYPCVCVCDGGGGDPTPFHSRWLVPLIPYLINMGYLWQPGNYWFKLCTSPVDSPNVDCYYIT